jgi:3-oxoacyl-[acyl-carrier protein] reductase
VDLRNPNQVEKFLQLVQDRYGGLHILINNIERGGMPVVHGSYDLEANRGQWDLEIETTLKAKWLVAHHALPLMKQSGSGIIINLTSIAGQVGRTGPAGLIFNDGYAAANRAISTFTETWAREGAPEIRVNELMLGFFETRHAEGTRGWELLSDIEKQALVKHTLLKRTGSLDDIVKAVLFLVRDAAYMTGSVIRLDGGYVLGGEDVPAMADGVVD